jgi:hypothetical protein
MRYINPKILLYYGFLLALVVGMTHLLSFELSTLLMAALAAYEINK